MDICLLSAAYPPSSTEGIARQRQALAHALVRMGHTVSVVTCGRSASVWDDQGAQVFEIAPRQINHFSDSFPELDSDLTVSQALYEGLERVRTQRPCELVDVPLWAAQGFVALQHYGGPVVVWLQTTAAQLVRLNGTPLSPAKRAALALERLCLERAAGLLADSRSVLEVTRRDYRPAAAAPHGLAYLGLPALPDASPERAARPEVEALVVGRLEQRKGTPLLFGLLPGLLRRHPQLRVRFVGRDNSANDGWHSRHSLDYPAFFQQRHSDLAGRVSFEGYVDEARLEQLYRRADLLLAPSLYESFGLMYLEAMRAGLPVATFANGGASEIFPRGEQDGALVAPPGQERQLAAAVGRLVEQPALRRELGAAGLARFRSSFTDQAMAEATLAFYQEVVARHRRPRPPARQGVQVMEALDVGDAVSSITRRNAGLLAQLGQPADILARFRHEQLLHEVRPLHSALGRPDLALLFHYWGFNSSAWLLKAHRGPKAVHYHNITPPEFFEPGSDLRAQTERGYAQLAAIAGCFDLVVGVSRYNVREFSRYLSAPRPALHLYPVIDPQAVASEVYDQALYRALRRPGQTNIVFVGRIARNKRQDRLIQLFDYYYREVDPRARLWLVGNDRGDPAYRAELERLRTGLPSADQIRFTGKVSDAEVNAYYRAADVFVCASEHEGFCVPIAQAMALDVPVLAYAAAAVPETMGCAGVLIPVWEVPRVAELMHTALTDQEARAALVRGQRDSLPRFSTDEARRRLAAIVGFLCRGEPSPLFEIGDAAQEQPALTLAR